MQGNIESLCCFDECWFKKIGGWNFFGPYDNTGQEVMFWRNNPPFCAKMSFEQVQEEQGLKEDDYVHEVFSLYLLESNLSHIGEVQKNRASRRIVRGDPLVEKIKSFIPEIMPGPVFGYWIN